MVYDAFTAAGAVILLSFWTIFIMLAEKHKDFVFSLVSFVLAAMIYANDFVKTVIVAYGITLGELFALVSIYYIFSILVLMIEKEKMKPKETGQPPPGD